MEWHQKTITFYKDITCIYIHVLYIFFIQLFMIIKNYLNAYEITFQLILVHQTKKISSRTIIQNDNFYINNL